jgi:hypothetical protein
VSGSKKVQLRVLASGPALYPSRCRTLFQQSTFGRRAFPERNLRIVKTLGKMGIRLMPGGRTVQAGKDGQGQVHEELSAGEDAEDGKSKASAVWS